MYICLRSIEDLPCGGRGHGFVEGGPSSGEECRRAGPKQQRLDTSDPELQSLDAGITAGNPAIDPSLAVLVTDGPAGRQGIRQARLSRIRAKECAW